MHMTRHEDRFVVRSRVTRELPGKICERLQRHTRASVKFKLSGTVLLIVMAGVLLDALVAYYVCMYTEYTFVATALPTQQLLSLPGINAKVIILTA